MSSRFDKMIKDFIDTIKENKKTIGPYDTVATVVRIENDTAFVHIPGGIDETPVSKTVDCKVGDEIQIRVGGGRAWIVGNATAPPTDDTTAIQASGIATKFITDTTNGIFVHPENDTKNGVRVTDGVYIIKDGKVIAKYGDETVIGEEIKKHLRLDNDSVDIKDGEKLLSSFDGEGLTVYDDNGEIAKFARGTSYDPDGQPIAFTPQVKLKKTYANDPSTMDEVNLDGLELSFSENDTSLDVPVYQARYTRWGILYNGSSTPVGTIYNGELYQQIEPIYIFGDGQYITTHQLIIPKGVWLINFGCAFQTDDNGSRMVVLNNSLTNTVAQNDDIIVKAAQSTYTIVSGTKIVQVTGASNEVWYLHVAHTAGAGTSLYISPYIRAVKLL